MSKFVMKCPICAKEDKKDVYVEVRGGLFNSGFLVKNKCPNGHKINVHANKMTTRKCSHCGNVVAFDQSAGDKAACPICKQPINTYNDNVNYVDIKCPTCNCTHTVAIAEEKIDCVICNTSIDVQKEITKIKMRKENVVSLIKYEGDNNTFVWKHPIEDFKLGSQHIVHDSQEALFFCGGQALDLFGGGTYTLTTENIPLLSAVYKVPSGEETFHSEVYFINKTVHMGIKWGTSSRIRIPDPYSGMNLSLGANGMFSMRVSDSKRLILKLVGTTDIFAHSNNLDNDAEDSKAKDSSADILRYIKSIIVNKVRTIFAAVIKKNGWSVFEIDAYIEQLSSEIKELINPELEEYGLILPDFLINNISTPEDLPAETEAEKKERELYIQIKQQAGNRFADIREAEIEADIALAQRKKKLVEAETEAQVAEVTARKDAMKDVIKAQAEAEGHKLMGMAEADVMRAKGYTGKDEMNYDVQKTFAQSVGTMGGGGAGGTLGDIVGLGAGLGMMSKIGSQVGNMMDAVSTSQVSMQEVKPGWNCSCGAKGIVGKFCNECGKPNPEPAETWDCACGAKGLAGKFCNECGRPKPTAMERWDCVCGAKGVKGKFCSECGRPKPGNNTWNCSCGATDLIGKFCNICGQPKPGNEGGKA